MQDASPTNTRIKLALALVFVIVAGWLGYLAYSRATFRIVDTTPSASNFPTSTPVFKVNFSQDISDKGIAVVGDPMVVTSTTVDGKTLNIHLKDPLDKSKKYTITINYVASKNGKSIRNKQFSFTPKEIDFDKLPADQQQTILDSQKPSDPANTDPILSHLPYATLDFRLDPVTSESNGKLVLTIEAQLYVLPNSGTSDADQIAQAKQEIANYFKQIGLDVANYNVQYQTVVQTLQGT